LSGIATELAKIAARPVWCGHEDQRPYGVAELFSRTSAAQVIIDTLEQPLRGSLTARAASSWLASG
jgi:hypothetical protein